MSKETKHSKILIFGGTTEGRALAEYLSGKGIGVRVCVATEYGESLLPSDKEIEVSCKRLGCGQMEELLQEYAPDFVIDTTHPYAKVVTANIREACERRGAACLRLIRESGGTDSAAVYVESIEEAVRFLEETEGNILLTTGSKELERYAALSDFGKRAYARVLPSEESVTKCMRLGISGQHLICMQGPFSAEMNLALLKDYNISYMVTKDSGAVGGYPQKCEAAQKAGVTLVVVGRPEKENGYNYGEIINILKKYYSFNSSVKVSIIGIGTGAKEFFTVYAEEACKKADVLIGAGRMLETAADKRKPKFLSYKPEEISTFIKAHPEYENVAVLMSGDTGFYSGADRLRKILSGEPGVEVEVVPGISSVSYFCAKLGITWEDAALASIHGRKENIVSIVRENRKTIVLTGSAQDVRNLCESLVKAGYGSLRASIGSSLSYEDERIMEGTAEEYAGYDGNGLAIMYIENPSGGNIPVSGGFPDRDFIRGDVPMTKEEVRSVILSKLRIRADSIVYDVGAGTGSVSVEAALHAVRGCVYAVERKPEAVDLIRQNSRRFKTDNLVIVQGEAPEMLSELPAPDCVFIGGNGGRLMEIVRTVAEKNPDVRVVVSAITLETLSEAVECCRQMPTSEKEVVQISVAKAKEVGNYQMMLGQNPVFLVSFTCDGKGQRK